MSESLEIPARLRGACDKCGSATAWVTTSRRLRGEPVEIEIDAAPDTGTGGTVAIQVSGTVLYGDAVPKTVAARMRATGRPLFSQHKMTCIHRNGTHKRS